MFRSWGKSNGGMSRDATVYGVERWWREQKIGHEPVKSLGTCDGRPVLARPSICPWAVASESGSLDAYKTTGVSAGCP